MNRAIYAIRSEAGPIKIGISKRPGKRLSALIKQQPFGADIIHVYAPEEDVAMAIEAAAHRLLSAKQRRGEWFDVTREEAIEAIREATVLVEETRHAKAEVGNETRKSRGRPRVDAILVGVRVPPDMIAAIDALIAANDNDTQSKSGRPEAMRFIIRDWLEKSGRL